jgi:hypothetical protein
MPGSSFCSRRSAAIRSGSCSRDARRTGDDREPIDQLLDLDLDCEDEIVIVYDLPAAKP